MLGCWINLGAIPSVFELSRTEAQHAADSSPLVGQHVSKQTSVKHKTHFIFMTRRPMSSLSRKLLNFSYVSPLAQRVFSTSNVKTKLPIGPILPVERLNLCLTNVYLLNKYPVQSSRLC